MLRVRIVDGLSLSLLFLLQKVDGVAGEHEVPTDETATAAAAAVAATLVADPTGGYAAEEMDVHAEV